MSTDTEPTSQAVAGDYQVVKQRQGEGIDCYLRVTGPDGRSTEQKVYWLYSMTPFQVAEAAVAGHLGPEQVTRPTTSREDPNGGGFVVTVA